MMMPSGPRKRVFIIPVMSIWGIFGNPLYGHPWTISKTISEITTSFSEKKIYFLGKIRQNFDTQIFLIKNYN
jgi:hypothetical protein